MLIIRLFLADDHTIVRGGIRALLAAEPSVQVVDEASHGHGQELPDRLPDTPADVVLLGLNMPVLDGLATKLRLRAEFPAVRILVPSMLGHERYIGQLLAAGAHGYALKNDEISEVVLAIQAVAAGKSYLGSELGIRMLQKVRTQQAQPRDLPAQLACNFSRRETEVLQLLAEGLATSQIAEKPFTSKRTIETHRQNMLEKKPGLERGCAHQAGHAAGRATVASPYPRPPRVSLRASKGGCFWAARARRPAAVPRGIAALPGLDAPAAAAKKHAAIAGPPPAVAGGGQRRL